MRLPAILELTKREQRTVILIVIALLAAAIVKHYRDQQSMGVPTTMSVKPNVTPSSGSEERETGEPDR
jgi:hypothetical protein